MTVGKIALGVFLGNLAFALIAWIVIAVAGDSLRRSAVYDATDQQYRELQSRQGHTP